LGLGCSVGVGFGDAAEGDFEAEGAELADVVGDLAADVALPLVVAGAEVLVAHAGVGQQLVQDFQLGVPGGDACFGRAASSGRKLNSCAYKDQPATCTATAVRTAAIVVAAAG
jgi:hypothetical protein